MDIAKIKAQPRSSTGKSAARQLKRDGQIPAVAYGKGLETASVSIAPKELFVVLSSAHGKNSVIELDVEGKTKLTVLCRDFQYHPISRELTHADFIQIYLDKPVDVEVPLICTGKSKGVVGGGVLQQVFRRLPLRCLPEKIPVSIEVDITDLDVGDGIKASTLNLPAGVTTTLAPEQTIVVVNAPEKAGADELTTAATPGAPAAAGAAGAPAAAAPAAGAAAAAGAAKKAEPAAKK